MDYGMEDDMDGMDGYGQEMGEMDEMGEMMDEYGDEGSHAQVRFKNSNIIHNRYLG